MQPFAGVAVIRCLDVAVLIGILRSAFPQSGKCCPEITFHSTENNVLLRQNIFFQCCGSGTSQ